jgi:hypothetical protein
VRRAGGGCQKAPTDSGTHRKTSVAQPARSAEIPRGSGLTANQVRLAGQCPLAPLSSSALPLPSREAHLAFSHPKSSHMLF